jgi:quinol monooxygenase YgiN
VSEKDNPARVKVFEVYASTEAYNAHLQAEHFKKYKRTTDPMVKSLKLVRVDPLLLGAKAR